MLITFFQSFSTILLPTPTCVYCQMPGSYVCNFCQTQLFESYRIDELNKEQFLSDKKLIDNLEIGFRYNRPIELFWEYAKHQGYYRVAEFAGELLAKELIKRKSKLLLADSIFVLVPLSEHKFKNRGYNQVEKMFMGMQKHMQNNYGINLRLLDVLRRKKDTKTQIGQNRQKRLINLADVFEAKLGFKLPKRVILLDDIYTTGATTEQCATALRKAGVESVSVLVFARG